MLFSYVLFRSYVSTKSGYPLVYLSRFYGNKKHKNQKHTRSFRSFVTFLAVCLALSNSSVVLSHISVTVSSFSSTRTLGAAKWPSISRNSPIRARMRASALSTCWITFIQYNFPLIIFKQIHLLYNFT